MKDPISLLANRALLYWLSVHENRTAIFWVSKGPVVNLTLRNEDRYEVSIAMTWTELRMASLDAAEKHIQFAINQLEGEQGCEGSETRRDEGAEGPDGDDNKQIHPREDCDQMGG